MIKNLLYFFTGILVANLYILNPYIKVGATPLEVTIFHQSNTPVQENINAKNYVHGAIYGNYQEIYDSYTSYIQKSSTPDDFQSNVKFYKQLLNNRKDQSIIYLGGKQLTDYGIFLYETVVSSTDNSSTDFIWIIITDETGKVADVK